MTTTDWGVNRMTITADTITADALEELTGAGETPEQLREALQELAEENADLRDELAESRLSTKLCIQVLERLTAEMYADDIAASDDGETAPGDGAGT